MSCLYSTFLDAAGGSLLCAPAGTAPESSSLPEAFCDGVRLNANAATKATRTKCFSNFDVLELIVESLKSVAADCHTSSAPGRQRTGRGGRGLTPRHYIARH